MRLALLGVRGSTPAPGESFVRYGGHTSCVVVLPDGPGAPTLILDAGTGLRELPGLLAGQPFRGSIILTHLHWDHLHGLPFCASIDRPDARVDLYLPAPAGGRSATELINHAMSPPHFPISPGGLLGSWRFHPSATARRTIERVTVTQTAITHKGGLTHGIRVDAGGVSMAYLPDHAPQLGSVAAEDLAAGVDILLHDGQFFDTEQATADAYGHATIRDALGFARRCGARRLVLTHHAPGRTDDQLDTVAKELAGARIELLVEIARQGDILQVS